MLAFAYGCMSVLVCLAIPAEHAPVVVWQLPLNPTQECNHDMYSLLQCIPQ